ncbi:MAG: hypothetical protein RL442_2897, partial [Pseudomonadota bacterium]
MLLQSFSRPVRWAGLLLTGSVVLLTACSRPAPVAEPVRAVKVVTVG